MSEQVCCPSCDAALRVPDNFLGKNVKCPICKTTFLAEADELVQPEGIVHQPSPGRHAPAPVDYDEEELLEEEEKGRQRRRGHRRSSSRMAAESAVIGPAISIMVVAGLSIAFGLGYLPFRILVFSLARQGRGGMPPAQAAGVIVGCIFAVVSTILPIVMVLGAVRMKNLHSYGLAMTSCVLAMFPLHFCCLLGLPVGIWGLVVLNKPEVKDAFL